MKRRFKLLLTFGVVLLFSLATYAQTLPPPPCAGRLQSSMVCVVPQTYGTNGLVLPNPNHAAHFEGSDAGFRKFFIPINSSIGTELSLLSIASPASGVLFTFDKALGTVTRANESYGPVLSERAETIGRHRLFLAGTYQFYDFSSLDGVDLKDLPVVFSHVRFQVPPGIFPPYEQDYITTQNRIDLKAHQATFYATYGLTNRIDVSVAVPIVDVRLSVTSAAHIVRIAPQPVAPTDPFFSSSVNGFFHFFDAADPAGSVDKVFTNARSASGLGDVVFRVKGTALKRERTRVALGLDVRTPTGDEKNLLGSGAPGVKPFVAVSYRARVSPHANLGFQWNGKSLLAGDVTTATTGKLPNQLFYSLGFDVGVTRRWTVAADLLGNRLSSGQRIRETSFVDVNGTTQPSVRQIAVFRDSVNMDDLSLGTKFSPKGNLLVTANVAIKLNDPGLRAKVVPLVGISYSF